MGRKESVEEAASSQVSVELFIGTRGTASSWVNRKIQIGVEGDVRKEPFSQLLLAAGGRGLVLFAGAAARSCAAVALPPLTKLEEESEACWDLQAVTLAALAPGPGILKVAWHPLSDAHLGVLFEDGSWSLVNLSAQASLRDPELYFEGPKAEQVVDFAWAFNGPQATTPEEAWLSLSVFFLGSSGRISLRNPVLPSVAVMPQAMLSALAADPNDWLREALSLLTAEHSIRTEHSSGGSCVLRHSLHLHARGPKGMAVEQTVEEALQDGPQSPQSARHAKSSYCSMQLLAGSSGLASPLVLIARATNSGLIQLLALEDAPGPAFTSLPAGKCTHRALLLEEIDLMCPHPAEASLQMLPLCNEGPGPGPSFLAYSNSLVAVVDVNLHGTSSVRTLAETRSEAKESSAEFAGLKLLDGRGLLLRVERRSSRSPIALQLLDFESKGIPGDKSEPREQSACKESQGTESLRLLLAPSSASSTSSGSPKDSEDRSAERMARKLSELQAQLGSLCPRQELVQHLQKTLPKRLEKLAEQLAELSEQSEQSGGHADSEDSFELSLALERRAEVLEGRQRRVVKALSAELELRALAALSSETAPRLFARFHELTRASKLLKTALIQASKTKKEAPTFAASPSILSLQKGWTGTTAQHLQLQASEADALVEAAAAKWP
ncbi:NUP88 [Symbiodinium sp. CCMP2592]|nr:NUP88 [Symbiodinium sp. CCMP2592]